ncbi:hypothetical protein [Streptomyces sp. NPDC000618]|uniref:hypothetical protein n=1 Tax=Streptomyces sp. NPDC000618 TaxID=3154265 RepID=UPI00331AB3DC
MSTQDEPTRKATSPEDIAQDVYAYAYLPRASYGQSTPRLDIPTNLRKSVVEVVAKKLPKERPSRFPFFGKLLQDRRIAAEAKRVVKAYEEERTNALRTSAGSAGRNAAGEVYERETPEAIDNSRKTAVEEQARAAAGLIFQADTVRALQQSISPQRSALAMASTNPT